MSSGTFRDDPDPADGAGGGGRPAETDPLGRAGVAFEQRDGCALAHVSGEIDYRTATWVRDRLLQAVRDDGAGCLVVDMEQVAFFDSSGLGTLVAVWKAAQLQGGRMVIARASGRCRHVLKITGVDRRIPVTDTLAEAVGQATPPAPGTGSGPAEPVG